MSRARATWFQALSALLHIIQTASEDICSTETFRAECAPGSVIVIRHSSYGRMRLNRCITVDLGHVGCSNNVTGILDQRCSTKQECSVQVPDSEMDRICPCLKDLTRYLEVEYTCEPVYRRPRSCLRSQPIVVPPPSAFFVSSLGSGMTSASCTYVLTVLEGQRINLTLMDFSAHLRQIESNTHVVTSPPSDCRRYATVTEMVSAINRDICASNRRISQVYESRSKKIELRLETRNLPDQTKFIIKYEATGCPNRAPIDEDQFSQRSRDTLHIGCRSNSRLQWSLQCEGNEWRGSVGNCTVKTVTSPGLLNDEDKKQKHGDTENDASESFLPKGFAVLLIVLIAILVGLCVVVFGLIISKRRKILLSRSNQQGTGCGPASTASHSAYPSYPDTKDLSNRYGSREEIEFGIYKHHNCPNAHALINAGDMSTTAPPCYNDYLYTLRIDNNQDTKGQSMGREERMNTDSISDSTTKRCTCKNYDIPADLTVPMTPKSNICVLNRAPANDWENSSLLMPDHEPDLITLKRQDMDHDG